MDKMTNGFIFVDPIPGDKGPKPVFMHHGITFSKSFWKGTTTITINVPEILAHSLFPEAAVSQIKNGEYLDVSTTKSQAFVMKRNDNWELCVHFSHRIDADGGTSIVSPWFFSNKTKI